MHIISQSAIKEYVTKHPNAAVPLDMWYRTTLRATWTCFADIKKTFNSVDYVGGQHYVFNIQHNEYRLVVVIKFSISMVYIRFIGTHKDDNIPDITKI